MSVPPDEPTPETSFNFFDIPAEAIAQYLESEKDTHYAAIGRVAAQWAEFEALVDGWALLFAGVTTEVGVCFTGQMIGPRPRLDAFIALARHFCPKSKHLKPLEDFAKDIVGLAEQRNRAVHDVWELTDPQQPQRYEATAKKTVRVLKIHVPTSKLLRLVENIKNKRDEFNKLAHLVWYERLQTGIAQP
jgi:hypothetical protein